MRGVPLGRRFSDGGGSSRRGRLRGFVAEFKNGFANRSRRVGSVQGELGGGLLEEGRVGLPRGAGWATLGEFVSLGCVGFGEGGLTYSYGHGGEVRGKFQPERSGLVKERDVLHRSVHRGLGVRGAESTDSPVGQRRAEKGEWGGGFPVEAVESPERVSLDRRPGSLRLGDRFGPSLDSAMVQRGYVTV